ncbi:hypothetical protein LJB85_01255 [Porphyromonadaceae bacterium OttesenSCG-928-L07]|nr:hypothetical protein [Porphyromonadaceae bacterium OttesenSCG-928-L07]MDL2252303.1 hypothetical protein [Odoribacter sp. OttesenSCG-928-J03]MDL2331173.1 hypothetical protein [Odoribacter sp. OttesenSCG-928-A06]
MIRIFLFALLFSLFGCTTRNAIIDIYVDDYSGDIKLLMESATNQDTILVAEGRGNMGHVKLAIKDIALPAVLFPEINHRIDTFFLLDSYDGVLVKIGRQHFEIEGSHLNDTYREVRDILLEKYDRPIGRIEEDVNKLSSKNRQGMYEGKLTLYARQKERYQDYRYKYVKKMIEANPSHDLSLFLLMAELKDSVSVQRQLFDSLQIKNKKSVLYGVVQKHIMQVE